MGRAPISAPEQETDFINTVEEHTVYKKGSEAELLMLKMIFLFGTWRPVLYCIPQNHMSCELSLSSTAVFSNLLPLCKHAAGPALVWQ